MHLIVVSPFAHYVRGDRITDPAEIEAIQNGEHAGHVVQVAETVEQPKE